MVLHHQYPGNLHQLLFLVSKLSNHMHQHYKKEHALCKYISHFPFGHQEVLRHTVVDNMLCIYTYINYLFY